MFHGYYFTSVLIHYTLAQMKLERLIQINYILLNHYTKEMKLEGSVQMNYFIPN